jgi:hypothetical protein
MVVKKALHLAKYVEMYLALKTERELGQCQVWGWRDSEGLLEGSNEGKEARPPDGILVWVLLGSFEGKVAVVMTINQHLRYRNTEDR